MKHSLRCSMLLPLLGCSVTVFGTASCTAPAEDANRPLYFATPEAAVETSTLLLRTKDWATLARYYDLTGSPVPAADLANGSFFYSDRVEGMQHPSGISKYKHPFAPGFRYLRTENAPQPDVIKVVMQIEIDQGIGAPPQRGLSAFLLRRSSRGYRFLPTRIDP